MPPDDGDYALPVDMLGFTREVVAFVRGRKRADLDSDRALLRSLERALELVGECARRISEGTRKSYPAIPWRE
jgi:uncharacterized protein with HEPN domain